MKFVVLGSGTLVPDAQTASAGYALLHRDEILLFDLGRGVMQRLSENGIDPLSVGQIHLSHYHPDHCCDLVPLLFSANYAPEPPRTQSMRLTGPEGLREFYERLCEAWPWLRTRFPLELVERADERWEQGGVNLRSVALTHGNRVNLGYRIEGGGRSLAYTGDTGPCDALLSLAGGVDILVSECSFPDSRARANHMSPTPLAEAATAAQVGTLVVSHVYPNASGTQHEEILEELRVSFDGEILMAYDGLTIEL